MLRSLLILTLAFSLGACSSGAPGDAGDLLSTPMPDGDAGWNIQFGLSGGFIGLNRTMEIDENGHVAVTDARTGKKVSSQLSSEQLTELGRLVQAAQFRPALKPSVCADCFVYTLQIDTGNGKPLSAQVDDTNLEQSGLSELVQFLRNIMESALKS